MSLLGLTAELGRRASEALAASVGAPDKLPAELPVLKAGRPEFGDFQISACLALGKALGRPPRELALVVAAALAGHPALASVETAGPGFINLRLADAVIAREAAALLDDPRLGLRPIGAGHRVVIDYSSPNVAKPMHIGHIRSTIIGAALDRTLAALGYEVITDNHLGDWGTQFGKLIVAYRRWLDADAYAADPVAELLRLYTRYNAEEERERAELHLKRPPPVTAPAPPPAPLGTIHGHGHGHGDGHGHGEGDGDEPDDEEGGAAAPPILEEARRELVKLQAGDPDNRALWRQFIDDSRHVFEAIYRRLGVHFDHWLGESAYNAMLPAVVEDLRRRGLAVPSQGALVVFLEEEKLPPSIVQKADGGFNYMATDLATMAVRTGTPPWPDPPAGPFQADRVIIVTDERQQLHFQQLFAVSRRLGVTAQLDHVWFGLMRMPEGTIKTRSAGKNVIFLGDLLDEAERRAYAVAADKAREQEPPLAEEELREIARVVGIGAVKYNDLSKDRQSLVTFTWDRALSLTGNTAPYLQYAFARIRSIVRKAGQPVATAALLLDTPVERELAKRLLAYPEAVENVARTLRPHAIADYLYDLATAFSGFYTDMPVLKAAPQVRASRLLLTELVSRVLSHGLGLLGIEVLERM